MQKHPFWRISAGFLHIQCNIVSPGSQNWRYTQRQTTTHTGSSWAKLTPVDSFPLGNLLKKVSTSHLGPSPPLCLNRLTLKDTVLNVSCQVPKWFTRFLTTIFISFWITQIISFHWIWSPGETSWHLWSSCLFFGISLCLWLQQSWYLPVRPGVCDVRPILHSPWVFFPTLPLLFFATYQEDEFRCCPGLLLIHFFFSYVWAFWSFHQYAGSFITLPDQSGVLPPTHRQHQKARDPFLKIHSLCFLSQFSWGVPLWLLLPSLSLSFESRSLQCTFLRSP